MDNLIVYAIPFFVLFIILEILASLAKDRKVYRLNDSISSLSCGILEQVTGVFTTAFLFSIYIAIYNYGGNKGLFSQPTWLNWILLFFAVDFCYYWFHRSSHMLNIGWAGHIVHHNSEEYNLTTALRQGPMQKFFSWPFYYPLAIFGFDPVMLLTVKSINTLYQFWLHTRLVGKIGPLEWILNTPSHHRIHHAKDLHYLDKNFGGTFIIWDRLFGTFSKEVEEPHYGVTREIKSFNPIWSVFQWWIHMFVHIKKIKGIFWKLIYPFMPPGWWPPGQTPDPNPISFVKYDPQHSKAQNIVLFIFLVVNFVGATYYLAFENSWTQNIKLSYAGLWIGLIIVMGILNNIEKPANNVS